MRTEANELLMFIWDFSNNDVRVFTTAVPRTRFVPYIVVDTESLSFRDIHTIIVYNASSDESETRHNSPFID